MNIPRFVPFTYDGTMGYIDTRQRPNYLGQIVQFASKELLDEFVARKIEETQVLLAGKVPDYNILVIYAGTMDKNDKPFTNLRDAVYILQKMANFYLEDKINNAPNRFKRYYQPEIETIKN